jgi:HD-GYP domain-containing protein (c-di-GMP phosphodiesterase class II)
MSTGVVSASRDALEDASQLLRALSSARQVYGLYPSGHPNRQQATDAALESIRRLRRSLAADPVVFIVRHAVYLGSVLMPRDSLTRYGLVDAFEKAGISAVEVLPGVREADIDVLVRILLGELSLDAELHGLALNRIRPDLDKEDDETERLSDMRRSYALGLEVLRHSAAAVAAGRPLDLEPTTRLVQQLSDQVIKDPTQALLLATLRSHDEYTYYHMLNVCLLSLALGYAVGLNPEQIVSLGIGALLHDVGKVYVPVEVLQHVGALNQEQWRLIQKHPVDGAGIVLSTGGTVLQPAAAIILEHHAAYNLSGYPPISGRSHPSLPARMVAVADCFDAVTTNRPYRKGEERRQGLNILLSGAGRGYDPRVVRTFVRLLGLFPVGSLVRLTNGAVGVVVRNHDQMLARPTIRLVLDANGTPCDPEELDLSEAASSGGFRWEVERSMDPWELGVDMTSLVLSGEVESPSMSEEPGPGLVHEPAHGETPPAGYVDTHAHPD